ncbi:MAG: DUF6398 domain-containing protein [Flavobacteriaceae bacterium]|jgi:hypothetical protein|nr:DUF6398 domain-containing protein [Flavobacteriaceae bacterium]
MDKHQAEEKGQKILKLVRDFCAKKLDDEYFELAEQLTQKLMRKRNKPLASGQPEIWAAAIIHALGTANFLFDKSFQPYISVVDLNKYFGTKQSTVSAKSAQIRDLLNIKRFGSEFSTQRMTDMNPFNNMVMVDGMIYPLSMLPEEIQIAVKQARAEGLDIEIRTEK